MTLALADVQTSLRQLLRTEAYTVQELPELSGIEGQVSRAYYELLGREAISPRQVMVREQFRAALEKWRSETELSSMLSEKRAHPAYQEIVNLGEEAIPLILEEIESRSSFIFMALHDITGGDPIPPEDRGRVPRMIEAWSRWGNEHGFRQ